MTTITPPELKCSVSEGLEGLTVAEVRAAERTYGKSLDKWSGVETTSALIRAYERRRFLAGDVDVKVDWPDVEAMTMRDVNAYFAPEAEDADDDAADAEGNVEKLDG